MRFLGAMSPRTLRIACALSMALSGIARPSAAATLTLAWDHSSSTATTGYLVSYGTQPTKYTTTVKAGYVTSVSITVAEGTMYYFVVQAYDASGATGPMSAEISGQAATPVVGIACPSPVLTSLDGKALSVTLTPVVSGGVAPITSTCSPASGSLFPVGTTPFTCTAVDAVQQKASCTSNVTVLTSTARPTPPTPAPALVCPAIPTTTVSGNSGKARVTFANPVFIDGTIPVTVSCTPKSGSQFSLGTTTVSCVGTNASQQSSSCTTTVTVEGSVR